MAPDRTAPSPSDLPAVNWSIADIHFGISAVSPARGRFFHWPTASARKSTPITTWTQLTPVAAPESGSSEPEATSTTTTLTITSPATHPRAKAGPLVFAFGVPSIKITAMIGSGLSATPTADGSRSPIACHNISPPSTRRSESCDPDDVKRLTVWDADAEVPRRDGL